MIDVPRDVAADRGVAHVQAIQLEAPDMALLQVPDLALETLAIGDLLTVVGDDALVLGDGLGGEDAPALESWSAVFRSSVARNSYSLPGPGRNTGDDSHHDRIGYQYRTRPTSTCTKFEIGIVADAADLQRDGGVPQVASFTPGTRMSIACPTMCRLCDATPVDAPPRSRSIALVSGDR